MLPESLLQKQLTLYLVGDLALITFLIRQLVQGAFPDTSFLTLVRAIGRDHVKLQRNLSVRHEPQHSCESVSVGWNKVLVAVLLHLDKVKCPHHVLQHVVEGICDFPGSLRVEASFVVPLAHLCHDLMCVEHGLCARYVRRLVYAAHAVAETTQDVLVHPRHQWWVEVALYPGPSSIALVGEPQLLYDL